MAADLDSESGKRREDACDGIRRLATALTAAVFLLSMLQFLVTHAGGVAVHHRSDPGPATSRRRLSMFRRSRARPGRDRPTTGDSEPVFQGGCQREQRARTNLVTLLPSLPGFDLAKYDGRCSRRYGAINEAWRACMAEPGCTGVVRDHGLECTPGKNLPFELRAGVSEASRQTNAWVCAERLRATEVTEAAARHTGAAPKEGFLFILHGGCARPDYNCTHVLELREAVASLRAQPLGGRPIAVLSDGAIPAAWLRSRLGVTFVQTLTAGNRSATAIDDDLRSKKLRAYPNTPFERTVFLDGDTFIRSDDVLQLFSVLGKFDLAAAFECCRLKWGDEKLGFDKTGLLRGWEMQTGVLAYVKNRRTDAYWAEAARIYNEMGGAYIVNLCSSLYLQICVEITC